MDSLTTRRLNSLPRFAREFYEQMPDGEYTTKELAKKLKRLPSSVGSMLGVIRKAGLIYSVRAEGTREYTHTKLDKADKKPQVIIKPHHKNIAHRNGSNGTSEYKKSVEALDKVFERIHKDLKTIQYTVKALEAIGAEGEKLKSKIEKILS